MIGSALAYIRKEINTYFHDQQHESRDIVVMATPADRNTHTQEDTSNRILLTLTNVLQENVIRNFPGTPVPREARTRPPPIGLNLHVLFAAQFSDYVTGMDFLSDVIAFLQARPVFDQKNAPGLNPRIERLAFQLLNVEYSELSFLWGMFHTDYRPSALYEIRMLTLPPPSLQAGPPSA